MPRLRSALLVAAPLALTGLPDGVDACPAAPGDAATGCPPDVRAPALMASVAAAPRLAALLEGATVRVRLIARAAKRLRAAPRPFKATLTTTATDAAGNAVSRTRKLTVRR